MHLIMRAAMPIIIGAHDRLHVQVPERKLASQLLVQMWSSYMDM
jgi:hypothetical protein